MKRYAVHIALGLGLAILLGGCGLLLNVAPKGGVPLNQPINTPVPPTPSFTAPEGLTMPDPNSYAMLFEDGSYVGLDGRKGCFDWWPCDDRWSEVELRVKHSDCAKLKVELIDANNALQEAQTAGQKEWQQGWYDVVNRSLTVMHCS